MCPRQWTVDHTAAQVSTEEDRPYQIKVNCKGGALCASVEANIRPWICGSSDRFSRTNKQEALYFYAHCHQEHTFDAPMVQLHFHSMINTFSTHRRLISADIEKHLLASACKPKVHTAAYSWPICMDSLGGRQCSMYFWQCLLSRLMSMSVHLGTLNSSLPDRAHNSRQSNHHLDGRVCANFCTIKNFA